MLAALTGSASTPRSPRRLVAAVPMRSAAAAPRPLRTAVGGAAKDCRMESGCPRCRARGVDGRSSKPRRGAALDARAVLALRRGRPRAPVRPAAPPRCRCVARGASGRASSSLIQGRRCPRGGAQRKVSSRLARSPFGSMRSVRDAVDGRSPGSARPVSPVFRRAAARPLADRAGDQILGVAEEHAVLRLLVLRRS